MDLTPEQTALALYNREQVTAAVLNALANRPGVPDPENDQVMKLVIGSTLDGLLAAIAFLAEMSDLYPAPRDRRRFADQCRDGLIKFMKVARNDIAAGLDWGQPPSFAANDPH